MSINLHGWTENLIRGLKKDPSYQLDSRISLNDLVELLAIRGISALRGFFIKPRLRASKGILFIGKRVTLRHKRKMSVGRSVIIDDHVTIDALSQKGVVLGNNVTLARFTTIQCTGVIQELGVGIQIGDNSAVGAFSFLGAQGGITIGSNVIMGPMVTMHAENHSFDLINIPIRLQPAFRKGIEIEDNCWIGAKATIVDGVHVGAGSVVAAGAVVTKDVKPNSVVAGIPAKIIRMREGE